MLYFFIILIAYIFDLFIIITFMDGILDKSKRKLSFLPFIACFMTTEFILFMTEKNTIHFSPAVSLLITIVISFGSTFLLTFIYATPFKIRILASVFFQIFALLGEYVFTFILHCTKPEIFDMDMTHLSALMNLGAKITLYIFVMLSVIFWKRRIRKHETIEYDVLLFMVPFFTLIIIIAMPIKNIMGTDFTSFSFLLFMSLSFLNITNYLLIDKIISMNEFKSKYLQMEQQVRYQREKYVQLGSYYKSMRSIIHDMKNHYFMISSYIENKEYFKLQDYMQEAILKMESCYAGVNTGNLVIDAFVSNFKMLSENNHILFHEDISIIPDKIPLTDYELCVVIGNLLDNAYQAVSVVKDKERVIDLHIYINDTDSFIIYEKNTYTPQTYASHKPDNHEHGYGLSNINRIVEKRHGLMQYKPLDTYFEITIIIPITDISKRIHQPIISHES